VHSPLCAIIGNTKYGAGADNNNKGNNTMTYHDIIGRLMMLATRLEAEGKEQDRQACAEAAGILMSMQGVRMGHPSLNEKAN
jgi:hypothetical protein